MERYSSYIIFIYADECNKILVKKTRSYLLYAKHCLRKVYWFSDSISINYVADALDGEMLFHNNDEKLGQKLDSNLKLRNESQNSPIYNIKYIRVNRKLKFFKIN